MKTIILILMLITVLTAQNIDYPRLLPTNTDADTAVTIYAETADSSKHIRLSDMRAELDTSNFTQPFNIWLDSLFPHADSGNATISGYSAYQWHPQTNLKLRNSIGWFDSTLIISNDDVYALYPYKYQTLFMSLDTIKTSDYAWSYPSGASGTDYNWFQNRMLQVISPNAASAHDLAATNLLVNTVIKDADHTVGNTTSLKVDATNYGTEKINGNWHALEFNLASLGPATNMKGFYGGGANYDSLSGFIYGMQAQTSNMYSSAAYGQRDINVYTPTIAGLRLKVQNYTNGGIGNQAIADNMYGFYGWLTNESAGTDSALVDKAYYLYGKNQNIGSRARIDSLYGLYLETPTNSGLIKKNYGIYVKNQDVSATHDNWAAYIEGPKSYIKNLQTDSVTVADSIVTAAKIAAWQAAADSVDQNVRSTASPTFLKANLTEAEIISDDNSVNRNVFVVRDSANNILLAIDASGQIFIRERNSTGTPNFPYTYADFTHSFMSNALRIGNVFGGYGFNIESNINRITSIGGIARSFYLSDSHGDIITIDPSIAGGTSNVGIKTTSPDSARLVVADDNPWAIVLGDKSSSPWSAIHVGDASFTTSSDSTHKNISKRKKPGKDKALREKVFDNILKAEETEYKWRPEFVRHKFDKKEIADWDSLTVIQRDSARIAWNIREEKKVDEICSRQRYGPTAQDIAAGIGGNGKEINWDKVNSKYREAVQELIMLVREQQAQIDALEARVTKLEKSKIIKGSIGRLK